MGGTNAAEGRVEICLNDQWGAVCNRMWDAIDAGVVCRQLGLTPDGEASIVHCMGESFTPVLVQGYAIIVFVCRLSKLCQT